MGPFLAQKADNVTYGPSWQHLFCQGIYVVQFLLEILTHLLQNYFDPPLHEVFQSSKTIHCQDDLRLVLLPVNILLEHLQFLHQFLHQL